MLRRKSNEVNGGVLKLVNERTARKIREGLLRPLSHLTPQPEGYGMPTQQYYFKRTIFFI